MIECENCGWQYDPVATRWRCTACGFKSHCCEGAAVAADRPGPPVSQGRAGPTS